MGIFEAILQSVNLTDIGNYYGTEDIERAKQKTKEEKAEFVEKLLSLIPSHPN